MAFYSSCHAFVHDVTRALKIVHVKSVKQRVVDSNQITFEGSVEVLIDQRLHVWADRITIYKNEQLLIAETVDTGAVVVEDNDFVILADRLEFNLQKKSGSAENIRLHVDEGYLSAGKAEKVNENDWCMENVVYTACDAQESHWNITAKRAVVHSSYFVSITNLLFKIGRVPVFALPRLALPIQGHSKSGFLIPRFFFDYKYGFGFKQEYYKYFTPHADATLGIDWRDKKGTMFFGEFRWALSPESFMQVNGEYAIIRDRFVERGSNIVKGTDRRYWLGGRDFRTFKQFMSGADLYTLTRIDFGDDKRIGYHFFNNTDGVDDTYFNTVDARLYWPCDTVNFFCQHQRVSRSRFVKLLPSQQQIVNAFAQQQNIQSPFAERELEARYHLSYLPQVSWGTSYKKIANFLQYKHNVYCDHVWSRQEELERLYVNESLLRQTDPIPYQKADVVRLNYRGVLTKSFTLAQNRVSFAVNPNISCASDRYFKPYVECGARWALPERTVCTPDYRFSYTLSPLFTWDLTSKFSQKQRAYFDYLDRAYPQNQLAATMRNAWSFDDVSFDVDITQAYDFYNQSDIFMLRRSDGKSHFLPLRYDIGFGYRDVRCDVSQEFGLRDGALLQSEISTSFNFRKARMGVSYLFQTRSLMTQRELLSNVPHFLNVNVGLPLGSHAALVYEGQFSALQRSSIFFFDGIKPLIHRVRLDYDGHCWGCYIGVEEKKYKECGIDRTERAVIFAFRLDSLGSFAKKFKNSPIFKNQSQVVS